MLLLERVADAVPLDAPALGDGGAVGLLPPLGALAMLGLRLHGALRLGSRSGRERGYCADSASGNQSEFAPFLAFGLDLLRAPGMGGLHHGRLDGERVRLAQGAEVGVAL